MSVAEQVREREILASHSTLLDAVKWSHARAGFNDKSLVFARLEEAKEIMDKFNFNDYPVHMITPFGSKLIWLNGRVKTQIPMYGWILRRIPVKTHEYRTGAVEDLYMQPMRKLAKDFFRELLDTMIIDQEITPVNIDLNPEYGANEIGLFGYSYVANINVLEQVS